MKKQHKTNIKIKHHKYNLYNRKKSKGRQALAIILTIVIAAALCVVGYGLGKPLMDYLNSRDETSDASSGWTPPTVEAETSESVETSEPATSEVEQPTPEAPTQQSPYVLPQTAVLNSAGLNGALAAAKSAGYDSAVVVLKDDNGNFLYKTNIEGIKDTEAVTGALSAEQICELITKAGMTPIAKISTLKDHVSPIYIDSLKYTTTDGWGWFDDYVESGGKRWVSPFNAETAKFMSDITAELSGAGFKTVILSDTIFPVFRPTDYTLLENIDDSAKRSAALWSVINAAKSGAERNGAKVLLEMSAADLFAQERLSTEAEPANDKTSLGSVELLLAYSPEKSDNAYADAKSFIGRMGATYNGQEYSVLIKRNSVPVAAFEELKRAFEEADISVICE